MKRKVFANIELSGIELYPDFEDKLPKQFKLSGDSLQFLPCEIISCYYEYPLKIMFPQRTSESYCQCIYTLNFGGGLVEGDNVNISLKVGKHCCALIATLSFPKVYCCENGLDSEQHVKYDVCSHALLCVLPDPLVCYKRASYIQTQSYYLDSNANVVSLDWFTSGRYERGECWDFTKLKSVSTFYINKSLVFKEAQNVQNVCLLSIKQAMKTYNCFGTCFVIGPHLTFLWEKLLSDFGKCHGYGEKYQSDVLFAVSPLHLTGEIKHVGCVLRFASESVSEAVRKLEKILEPVLDLIEENPFQHK